MHFGRWFSLSRRSLNTQFDVGLSDKSGFQPLDKTVVIS